MFARLVSIMLLLPVGTPASAADWVKIRTKAERTYYIDANSIVARGVFRDVWEKTVIDVPDSTKVSVDVGRWRYDCAKRRSTMLYSGSYLKDATSVDGAGIPSSQRIWDDVRPASVAAAALDFACSRKGVP